MYQQELFSGLILILTVVAGAFLALKIKVEEESRFKTVLAFSGAFLFSITIIHLIPELFDLAYIHFGHDHDHHHEHVHNPNLTIGLFVLGGFFLQQFLEYFSIGIEHGHYHVHQKINATSILIALCIHSFLEGTILVHNHALGDVSHGHSVLLGIVLHKLPSAFVLTSLLLNTKRSGLNIFMLLTVFALASPLGVFVGAFSFSQQWISNEMFVYLFAIVAGNFLHISTTIFIEASPEHKIKYQKVLAIATGVAFAIVSQYF